MFFLVFLFCSSIDNQLRCSSISSHRFPVELVTFILKSSWMARLAWIFRNVNFLKSPIQSVFISFCFVSEVQQITLTILYPPIFLALYQLIFFGIAQWKNFLKKNKFSKYIYWNQFEWEVPVFNQQYSYIKSLVYIPNHFTNHNL